MDNKRIVSCWISQDKGGCYDLVSRVNSFQYNISLDDCDVMFMCSSDDAAIEHVEKELLKNYNVKRNPLLTNPTILSTTV